MRAPYVIKADGLASGKGVVLPETLDAALKELEEIFTGKFGDASSKVLIEEFMEGQEASFFAISDGVNILPLIAAQDHKRAFDGDKGPNTGGMGAYSPTPVFNKEIQKIVMNKIIIPTVKGMAADGTPYVGILFAGLMITNEGPKLIEYNARFGDPECQVLMRRLNSDLMDIFLKAEKGNLDAIKELIWSNKPTVNIVLANNGYPGKYKNGSIIKGIDKANSKNEIVIFHAGTKYNENNNICSAGGRVLNVTSQADTLNKALERAYEAIDNDIEWDDGFCRRDIGYQAVC
jgi:phosphoribosylamine--glycine ligase